MAVAGIQWKIKSTTKQRSQISINFNKYSLSSEIKIVSIDNWMTTRRLRDWGSLPEKQRE